MERAHEELANDNQSLKRGNSQRVVEDRDLGMIIGGTILLHSSKIKHDNPIPFMYGIFTYIWLFFMVKYGKCR